MHIISNWDLLNWLSWVLYQWIKCLSIKCLKDMRNKNKNLLNWTEISPFTRSPFFLQRKLLKYLQDWISNKLHLNKIVTMLDYGARKELRQKLTYFATDTHRTFFYFLKLQKITFAFVLVQCSYNWNFLLHNPLENKGCKI